MAKEVKKAAYKKAKAARSVSISQTEWKTGVAGAKGKAGRLYGPKGQRYTGTVDLGGGKTAVYKQGKRVTRAKTQGGGFTGYKSPKSSSGSSRTSGGISVPEVTKNPKYTSAGPKFGGGSGYKPSVPSVANKPASMGAEGPKRAMPVPAAQSQAARAKQRRQLVLKAAGVAMPATRPFYLGHMLLTSPAAKTAKKTPGLVIKKATDWWAGK